MTARQLQIFADCPYGGCEDGYCACLEQDVDPEDFEDLDPDELADLYDPYVPERTVRRYCPVCGQVVDADEDDPDRVPTHDWFGDRVLTYCPGSDTRQPLEAAP